MITDIWTGPLPDGFQVRNGDPYPSLVALNSEQDWQTAIVAYSFAFPSSGSLPPRDMPLDACLDLTLLALGFRVSAGIYRDRKVSLAASDVGTQFHLFAVPLIFFYKPVVDFWAYDREGHPLSVVRAVPVGARARRGRLRR